MYTRLEICARCDGNGWIVLCDVCGDDCLDDDLHEAHSLPCPDCYGTGEVAS